MPIEIVAKYHPDVWSKKAAPAMKLINIIAKIINHNGQEKNRGATQ